jgi:hypothetical protein
MLAKLICVGILLVGGAMDTFGQLAGSRTYNSLNLPISARAAALGGSAYAIQTLDPGLVTANPALLHPELHKRLSFNTGFYLAGTNFGTFNYTHHAEKLKTSFLGSVTYVSYGKFDGRDPAGNPVGDFRAGDVVLSGGAARYWKKFTYGAQLRMVFSNIEQYSSFGISTDWAATYHNEEKFFTAALLLRNAGAQLTTYVAGGEREPLPLDVSLAISKRFDKLPFRLQVVAHNLQTWDLTYPERPGGSFLINTGTSQDRGFIDKLFAHVILGGEIEASKPIRIRFGYNHLVRQSLANTERKGLAGFSGGLGIVIQQFTFDYAVSKYHPAGTLNQVGLSINLNEWGNKAN